MAVDPHGSRRHVVQARQQRDGRRLAGTGRADERHGLAGLDPQRQPAQDVDIGVGVATEPGILLHRGDRRLRCRRIAEHDVVELDRPPRADEIDGARPFLDRLGSVEHLEHPLEADHRGHQVDPCVGQPGEWLVHAGDQCRERHQGADLDRTVDHHHRPDAVDRCGAERTDEPERHEEHPAEHRRLDAGVTHATGPTLERLALTGTRPEQLHQACSRHVETLGHLGVHRRVVAHLLTRDPLQSQPDPARRHDEQWQHHERQQREAPLEREHRCQRGGEHDHVAHDAAERAGHGGLRADHVVVEP